ncbi:MAG: PQQ-binding-like beta-propeller repeat protein [Bdellovibrionia bacterium]
MVKKFKLIHLRNCTVLLILCHSHVTHATDITSDLNYRLSASNNTLSSETGTTALLWSKQMSGAISDLSISKNGKAIVVATSPDSDIEGSAKHYLLSSYSSTGKLNWQLKQSSPVKEVAVSQDASFVVVSNYENQLFALNADGKTLWSVEGMCRPIISNSNKKIICYHDDDNDPKVAFDLYDWKGKKISSYGITKDVLALKLSADEKHLVLAQADGGVVFFSSDFIPLWHKTVSGEIVDIAVSSGPTPIVAVLYRNKSKPKLEHVAILNSLGSTQAQPRLDLKGKPKSEPAKLLSPSVSCNQIELSAGGTTLFYYGNSPSGQFLGSLSVLSSKELWKRGGSMPTEYNSSIHVGSTQVFMGFQENAAGERRSHVLSFNYEGEIKADIRLSLEQSAYLYSFKVAPEGDLLAVGTDDGKISVYRY